jgi:CheY-like chemotaxis protein/anti-sigma regulatory factor (Ser/Thr protein kinase)
MSKIETGRLELNPTEYETANLINDAVQVNIVRIGSKPIEFILDIDENLPSRMFGDELRLKQILNNVLSNAVKYTEKGSVKLSVSYENRDDDIMVCFVVRDTGQGMKREDKERLFTEYSRFNFEENRSTEGAGLGLHIVKNLAEMMDGTARAESEYGKGSIFIITVKQKVVDNKPISPEDLHKLETFSYSAKREEQDISHTAMPHGSVLIVDDVETNLFVARGLMSGYKLNIETADSGFKVIESVESGKSYDIIFMDHMMPKMDGIETTQKLRERGYKNPIVALTANALVGNNEMFLQKGFDGFISKPIDVNQLDSVLNRFIREQYPEEAKKYTNHAKVAAQEVNPEMLSAFRRDAQKAIVTLRESRESNNLKLFATTAHAMRSALANVGEKEVSEKAFALEKAGKSGDTEYISANTDVFIETLEFLMNKAGGDGNRHVTEAEEDTEYLKNQLQIITRACEDYDDETAYKAFELLNKKSWSSQTAAKIDEIHNMLSMDSDFEGVAQMIQTVFR